MKLWQKVFPVYYGFPEESMPSLSFCRILVWVSLWVCLVGCVAMDRCTSLRICALGGYETLTAIEGFLRFVRFSLRESTLFLLYASPIDSGRNPDSSSTLYGPQSCVPIVAPGSIAWGEPRGLGEAKLDHEPTTVLSSREAREERNYS
jgi:hypothetical protein